MRRLAAWLLIFCLLPVCASAAPQTPYDPGLMLRYQMLTASQKTLFDLLYTAAKNGETTAELPSGTTYNDTVAAMDALLDDCPELCALESRYSIRYYQQAPNIATAVELSYALPLQTQETLLETARALAEDAAGDAYTRELCLHDALCAGTSYDLTTAAQATAYGALVEGRAGCEGYARALILLCRLAGIPSGLVSGTAWSEGAAERHAWCVMSVGGVLTQTDPTWNDQEHLGMNTHWYFNLTDTQMGADHQRDEELLLPPCTDASASWHARNGWLVPDTGGEEVIRRALRLFATEKTAVNLRFEDAQAAADFTDNMDEWLTIYNEENPDAAFYGSYRMARSVSQGCVLLMTGP